MIDLQKIGNDWAAGQKLAIQLSRQGERDAVEFLPHERETLERDYARSIYESCDREDAEAERIANVCTECGNDPTCRSPHARECSQHPDNIRDASMCPNCGQDHCVCEKRGGVVQGVVSRRAKGGR